MPPRMPNLRRGRDELTAFLSMLDPGSEVQLDIKRKEGKKSEKIKLALGTYSDEVPDKLLAPLSKKGSQAPSSKKGGGLEKKPADAKSADKKQQTGLLKRKTPEGDHQYWLWVPENYDANISHALVVWLHPAGKARDRETEELLNQWRSYCSERHIIFVCPKAESDNGWSGGDTDFVVQLVRDITSEYKIDRQRVIAHGMGDGGPDPRRGNLRRRADQ
jgi:predicted peptidase